MVLRAAPGGTRARRTLAARLGMTNDVEAVVLAAALLATLDCRAISRMPEVRKPSMLRTPTMLATRNIATRNCVMLKATRQKNPTIRATWSTGTVRRAAVLWQKHTTLVIDPCQKRTTPAAVHRVRASRAMA